LHATLNSALKIIRVTGVLHPRTGAIASVLVAELSLEDCGLATRPDDLHGDDEQQQS
jgi:hypothetical protein